MRPLRCGVLIARVLPLLRLSPRSGPPRLSPAAADTARRRVRRKARKKGRRPSTTALGLADWLLVVTTVAAADGPLADGLRLSRARWHVARVFKRLHQRLRLQPRRSTHPTSVAATGWARLVAWARPEGRRGARRAPRPTGTPTTPRAGRNGG